MKTTKQIQKIIEDLLDFPAYKIKYAVKTNLIKGMFLTLKNYNIKLTKEVFDIFYDVLNEKLSGSKDIEYEFETEKEYDNVMNLLNFCK